MKEEQGKKLDPNDPAIPAKPTALPDEDLDKVAGGSLYLKVIHGMSTTIVNPAPGGGSSNS
jgi:hypothetical protein